MKGSAAVVGGGADGVKRTMEQSVACLGKRKLSLWPRRSAVVSGGADGVKRTMEQGRK